MRLCLIALLATFVGACNGCDRYRSDRADSRKVGPFAPPDDEAPPPTSNAGRGANPCICVTSTVDRDGDCALDTIEDTNSSNTYDAGDFTNIDDSDTDDDGILDGCEDRNRNGIVDAYPPEQDPRNPDSDGDGLRDGLEDSNQNGVLDLGETDAMHPDTDRDGIPDGIEDRNKNGFVDCGTFVAPTPEPCETNPRSTDSDGDGLTDPVELKTLNDPLLPTYDFLNGTIPVVQTPHCDGPNGFRGRSANDPLDDQTCPWSQDSDRDGILDGLEDRNGDGVVSTGETDPRSQDSDRDGLSDGKEDTNQDGIWDVIAETNAAVLDTDRDGLSDGLEDSGGCTTIAMGATETCGGAPTGGDNPCDCAHWRNGALETNESDPRVADTDIDGLKDGVEDRNGDGVCQKPLPRAIPRASDESCGYLKDSDGDNLPDGFEDANANSQIDLGETDPRRADPDNDCLIDSSELGTGTNPFVADTDEDGLADGLESEEQLRFDGTNCLPVVCSGASVSYTTATCPNPHIRDTDGDGEADGFEVLNGVITGEDENKNGCRDPGESDPCAVDAPQPPAYTQTACTLASCGPTVDLIGCSCRDPLNPNTCGGGFSTCGSGTCVVGDGDTAACSCSADSPCMIARKAGQALVCADGNVRPVTVIRSEDNDYALALPGKKGMIGGVPDPLFDSEALSLGGVLVGHAFQSKDAVALAAPEPLSGIYGSIVRMGTLKTGAMCAEVLDAPPLIDHILPPPMATSCPPAQNFLVWSAALTPTDVAERAATRISAQLAALGYTIERTAGGVTLAHDDETGYRPQGTSVTTATDIYVLRRPTGTIDTAQIERVATSALMGGVTLTRTLPATAAKTGASAQLRIEYYRRLVARRDSLPGGGQTIVRIAQYGAVLATSALAQDCSGLTGATRLACKKSVEASLTPLVDLTGGSSLARYQAQIESACDAFDPKKAKADFLLGIDDSGSMQEFILAIQRAVREVALKLQANSENMDWRIAMTTSSMGQGDDDGPVASTGPFALTDAFEPGADGTGLLGAYPKLDPTGAKPDTFFGYQTTAFDDTGTPQRCTYSDTFDAADPLKSPYCCDLATAPGLAGDADFVTQCCSLPSGTAAPAAFYGSAFTLSDPNGDAFAVPFDPKRNDTLRCFDIPRFGKEPAQAWTYIQYYSTGDSSSTASLITQDNNVESRHLNDYLCGDWQLQSDAFGTYSLQNYVARPLWGARGHLWPPGFLGESALNPRLDGANLLVRNADMLVIQMNRRCYRNTANTSLELSPPRTLQDSGAEMLLQAVKRAIQRSTVSGRGATPKTLRPDAPLITLLLSDEEDFSLKLHDDSAARTNRSNLAERDYNQLPPAECLQNGDNGCTLAYCQDTCYGALVDQGAATDRIPSARSYSSATKTITKDSVQGSYCVAPTSGAASVNGDCGPGNFCATGGTDRYDGFHRITASEDPNDDVSLTNQQSEANSRSRDVLNNGSQICPGPTCDTAPKVAPSCNAACGSDCLPCMRFLREKQYVDYLAGKCSPPGGDISDLSDTRRYPRPTVATRTGDRVLPLGLTYAITRRPNLPGGTQGSCGSPYSGGDGAAHRNVALASGGRVADLCLAETPTGYAEFLDQIVVDAQGIGSPYRLSGNPIATTIRVGVLGKDGNLRMIRRSSIAGFDYNTTSRSIAFFAETKTDLYNAVSEIRDAKVFISYLVWKRQCSEDCPLGDVCAICTCSATNPECCTPNPTFICQSPSPCPQGCAPCEQCDPATNVCKPVDVCGTGCAMGECTKNGCSICPTGTLVEVPCNPLTGACRVPELQVCMSRDGIPNPDGTSCVVTNAAFDCCGAQRTCGAGEVCVLRPCAGGGCLPTAECHKPVADPMGYDLDEWCGACPIGTACAPVPCPGDNCRPEFRCVADNPGSTARCEPGPECGCPGGVCTDCPTAFYCDPNRQCTNLCATNISTLECCTDPTLRVKDPITLEPLSCCPPGEHFEPTTLQCEPGVLCDGPCPEGFFCDPYSGRCVPRGN
ncbi:MAG: hypothetical protein IT381_15250 [Deltaproteobacteria bacterium]|nr:hypothetical protein [Deltaproteobacteria bacterium]